MTDNEIKREKTFSEELPYFKERMKEISDNYDNPDGYADVLYLSALSDSNRIVRKAEEEINRQQAEIERLKYEMGKLLPKGCPYAMQIEVSNKLETIIRAEAIKEFAKRLKEMKYESIEWAHGEHPYVVEESDIDNLVEEMVGEK